MKLLLILFFCMTLYVFPSNNWEIVDSIPVTKASFWRLKCADSLNCMYLANLQSAGGFYIKRTTDGGKTWSKVYIDSGYVNNIHDYHFVPIMRDMAYPNKKLCIAVGDSGLVVRSTDNGDTWETFRTDTKANNDFIIMFDNNIGISTRTNIETKKVYMYKTTDGGITWELTDWYQTEKNKIPIIAREIQYINKDLFASYTMHKDESGVLNKYLIYVHNNWESWDTVLAPYYTTDLSFVDENNVWAAGNEQKFVTGGAYYWRQYIYHSSDGGHTWETQWDSVLNKFAIFDIEFYDKKFGIASSRLGEVLFTEDGGRTWTAEYITGEKPEGYERIANNIQIPNRNNIFLIYGFRYIYKWTRTPIAGVDDRINENNITISPNPAGDYIDISTNAVIPAKAGISADIKIYDVLGVCVLTLPCHSCESRNLGKREEIPNQIGNDRTLLRIDVSGLAAGVYFVRVGGQLLKFVKI